MKFDAIYAGRTKIGERAPWDIGEPQPEFIDLEESGAIRGSVLDAGCGTGEHALYLAAKGYVATGIDISAVAIEKARNKAESRGLSVDFTVGDAFELAEFDGRFDTVVDCGLFDVCPSERQRNYAEALRRSCKTGAHVYMLELSAESTEYMRRSFITLGVPERFLTGFPRLKPDDLRDAFTDGWDEIWLEESAMRVKMPEVAELMDVPALRAAFRRR